MKIRAVEISSGASGWRFRESLHQRKISRYTLLCNDEQEEDIRSITLSHANGSELSHKNKEKLTNMRKSKGEKVKHCPYAVESYSLQGHPSPLLIRSFP